MESNSDAIAPCFVNTRFDKAEQQKQAFLDWFVERGLCEKDALRQKRFRAEFRCRFAPIFALSQHSALLRVFRSVTFRVAALLARTLAAIRQLPSLRESSDCVFWRFLLRASCFARKLGSLKSCRKRARHERKQQASLTILRAADECALLRSICCSCARTEAEPTWLLLSPRIVINTGAFNGDSEKKPTSKKSSRQSVMRRWAIFRSVAD